MVKHYKNFNIQKKHKGSIILIGNFDGLHLGHQKLFQLAQSYKKKYNLKIGVVNFNPMPKMFFNKKLKNFRLSNIDQKIKLLSFFKIDFVAQIIDVQIFDKLRKKKWFIAPLTSSIIGSSIDTFLFFSISFYGSDVPWITLALGDLVVKIAVALIMLIPFRILLKTFKPV